ncbi:MAG TPA: 3-deoxy-8-phosphooctulonate synthase [Candidatus Kapabacteria bacterium]|nr:3-deoxy-8-phosphooctulonate synthase [Candidatus Kapabacteria bacterium]
MHIGSFDLASDIFFIAGPCLVEGEEMIHTVAEHLAGIAARHGVALILKGSFKKANRTSGDSFTTIGERTALELLAAAGAANGLPTVTDIHTEADAELAADYVDVLQIPAFLCRQTELIQAAARTGRAVTIKKGQFVAPEDMRHAVAKAQAAGNSRVMLCERGTTFGYHNLVVDMRSLVIMREAGVPIVYDATHSVQLPSVAGVSSGQPQFILPLARAAVATGVDGVFFETHPDPAQALSDAATQLPLERAEEFIAACAGLHRWLREHSEGSRH